MVCEYMLLASNRFFSRSNATRFACREVLFGRRAFCEKILNLECGVAIGTFLLDRGVALTGIMAGAADGADGAEGGRAEAAAAAVVVKADGLGSDEDNGTVGAEDMEDGEGVGAVGREVGAAEVGVDVEFVREELFFGRVVSKLFFESFVLVLFSRAPPRLSPPPRPPPFLVLFLFVTFLLEFPLALVLLVLVLPPRLSLEELATFASTRFRDEAARRAREDAVGAKRRLFTTARFLETLL